uniref:NSD Cys-His rich domain n=1 Tax=Podoviridae sp. ctaUh10 TaxID=2826563 RepID=A0A8S5QST9_9CAUD|nr:MAG TPA: NSD Cys-His rich domain [Podoviridae sp. ctaUh10]
MESMTCGRVSAYECQYCKVASDSSCYQYEC